MVAGATAYGLELLAVARIHRVPDADPDAVLVPIAWAERSLPSHDGGTINLVDTGEAVSSNVRSNLAEPLPTLVFSHGVTLSIRTWVRQIDTFAREGFRVVAFDHRGHGGAALGRNGFGVTDIGDDIDTLLEVLDLNKVILIGHSMGGIAAQSYLVRHREAANRRVCGLVLLSTLPSAMSGSQAARFGKVVERVTRRTPDSTRLWAHPHLGLLLARFGFGRDPRASDVELVRQMMLECDRKTRVEGPRSLIGFDLVRELGSISQPTLVIGGTADVITPPHDSQRMHDAIVGSELILFEGGGHMLMLERYREVNEAIRSFALKCAARRAGRQT